VSASRRAQAIRPLVFRYLWLCALAENDGMDLIGNGYRLRRDWFNDVIAEFIKEFLAKIDSTLNIRRPSMRNSI
jgi:hypothetical protein